MPVKRPPYLESRDRITTRPSAESAVFPQFEVPDGAEADYFGADAGPLTTKYEALPTGHEHSESVGMAEPRSSRGSDRLVRAQDRSPLPDLPAHTDGVRSDLFESIVFVFRRIAGRGEGLA